MTTDNHSKNGKGQGADQRGASQGIGAGADAAARTVKPAGKAGRKPDLTQVSLLLIDANQFERRLLAQVCRSFDIHKITDFAAADEALEALRTKTFDLVFCDFDIQGMTGLDFVRAVRSDPGIQDRQTPIIMLTSHTRYSEILAARDSGITEFLAKPVSPKLLLERMTLVFTRPRPFIESDSYIGPSRRRRDVAWDGVDRRQRSEPAAGDLESPAPGDGGPGPKTPDGAGA